MAPRGYAWWYLDALSSDGQHAITLIAMLGNVFSPYYARVRTTSPESADPLQHCTLHAAIYGPGDRSAWTLTERRGTEVARARDHLVIGRSVVRWQGDCLVFSLDEPTAPFPGRVRGTVRLHPTTLPSVRHAIDDEGKHIWWPVAPSARVEVSLDTPRVHWSGLGYHDANAGSEGLEEGFVRWQWSRAAVPGGAVIHYDLVPRHGPGRVISLGFDHADRTVTLETPPRQHLPSTRWGLARSTRAEHGEVCTLARTLEDTPFYARSILAGRIRGEHAQVLHESLDLQRFRAGWVRFLLPFRMRRA